MIDFLTITSYNISSSSFDCYQEPLKFAITQLDWNYPTEGDGLPKFQEPGKWDNNSYVQALPINLEGDIVGDDSSDYIVQRRLFLAAITPAIEMTQRNHSRITIQMAGDGTTYFADVQLKTLSVPMVAGYPSVTSVTVGWECNFGYWRNLSTGSAVIL